MQDIRLIGLDLDGTVFDDAKHISPRNLAAIEAAVQAGIIVLPATGRTATGVPQAFTGIPGVHYALISNGASVVDMRTGEHIVDQPFSLEDSLRVYDVLKPFGGVFSLFVGGKSYATKADNDLIDVLVPENMRDYFRKTRIEVPDLRTVLQEKVGQVEKFSVMYPKVELRDEAWRAVLAACPDVEATTSLGSNIELNAPGVTKGSGLLALAEKLGLRRDQVMAVGDSGNDLSMIEDAGLGVAMGNATPEILAAADAVTTDNNHDGVALAIEKYALHLSLIHISAPDEKYHINQSFTLATKWANRISHDDWQMGKVPTTTSSVSYTHLDVYKRQDPALGAARP